MATLQRFKQLFGRDEARIGLAEACLLIAEHAYPGLQVDEYLGEIERFAARLRGRLPQASMVEDKVIALNQFVFDELGFCGNTDHYYDPRNSYLNEVIDRRSGIPITLSVLYIEIGRRIGLQLDGVSFPGHFLVRLKLGGGTLVLDPFSGGEPQSADDLREILQRVVASTGRSGARPAKDVVAGLPLEEFLAPAGARQIIARVLRNLKGIYLQKDEPQRLLEIFDRILIVTPEVHAELRDRGLVYQRLEAFRAARKDLSDYLERQPDAADGAEIRARLAELNAICARLN